MYIQSWHFIITYLQRIWWLCTYYGIYRNRSLSGKCTAEGGKTVYTGSDWKPVSYTTADGEKKTVTIRTGYEIIERTVDKYGQFLFPTDIEVNTWWTNTGMTDEEVIQNYHAHGECEQFHSEMRHTFARVYSAFADFQL